MNITAEQLRRLQVLYSQYAAHSLDVDNTRASRIAFGSARIGRKIDSFSDLTIDEAILLIDGLQRALGVAMPSKTPRRRQTRKDAEKAATEGRHDQIHAETTLASESDYRRIAREVERLGWTQARLEGWLASQRSPLPVGKDGRRTTIRTLGDANRVYWGLKRMARRAEHAPPDQAPISAAR